MNRSEAEYRDLILGYLFFRRDSLQAGKALIAELQSRGGSLTPKEMAEFVRKLESGAFGFKFSKHNFYRNVLRTFMNMGFIGKAPRLDRATMKTVMVYRPIEQPIPARRPDSPSFWHVAYEICSWWNSLMFSQGDASPAQRQAGGPTGG